MNPWVSLRGRYRVNGDPLRTQRRIELVVLALAALFCLQLLYSLVRLAITAAPDAISPAADALQFEPPGHGRPVEQSAREEIRSRPLFWPSRRPGESGGPSSGTESEKVQAGELAGVKLQGVFGSGDTAGLIALVKDKKQRILLGEQLEGWTLESVAADRVVLVSGGRRQELLLKTATVVADEPVRQEARGESDRKDTVVEAEEQQEAGAAEPRPRVIAPPDPRGLSRR